MNETIAIVDTIVDIFFVADMMLSFCTTYVDKRGAEVFSYKRIAKNYLRKRFLIDILSTFPIDKLLSILNSSYYQNAIIIISLLKVLRLRRISLLSKNREEMLFRFFQIIINFIVIIHITGCI